MLNLNQILLKSEKLLSSPFNDEYEIIEELTNTIESEASAGGLVSPPDNIVNEENNGILMLEMNQKVVKLNKLIYCYMKILDLSKFHMYHIWYTLLKPICYHALTLILMDTDSFVFSVLEMNEQKYN